MKESVCTIGACRSPVSIWLFSPPRVKCRGLGSAFRPRASAFRGGGLGSPRATLDMPRGNLRTPSSNLGARRGKTWDSVGGTWHAEGRPWDVEGVNLGCRDKHSATRGEALGTRRAH